MLQRSNPESPVSHPLQSTQPIGTAPWPEWAWPAVALLLPLAAAVLLPGPVAFLACLSAATAAGVGVAKLRRSG